MGEYPPAEEYSSSASEKLTDDSASDSWLRSSSSGSDDGVGLRERNFSGASWEG